MTLAVALLLAIIITASVLMVATRLRPDLVALLTLVTLGLSGLVTPADAFAGFSGPAVITILSIFVVSGALRDAGLAPFGLLDFLPVGFLVVLAGTAHMVFFGRRLLPSRYPAGQAARAVRLWAELEGLYGIEESLGELEVLPGSGLAGLSLNHGSWARDLGLSVVAVARDGQVQVAPPREETIRVGDVLFAQGTPEARVLQENGLRLLEEPVVPLQVTDEEVVLGEAVLSPHGRVAGRTLRQLHFREKQGLNVLALWRQGQPIHLGLADLPLQPGDAILVQGAASRMRQLREERDFLLMEEDPEAVLNPGKVRLAAGIGLVTLAAAATGWLPVSVITLSGATLMLLTGCLSMDDAYCSVEWKSVFLIAGMWPLGTAIASTGLAGRIAGDLTQLSAGAGTLAAAGLLLLVAAVLNQLIAGQAAVPIMLAPIGLALAQPSGADPRSLAMAVAWAPTGWGSRSPLAAWACVAGSHPPGSPTVAPGARCGRSCAADSGRTARLRSVAPLPAQWPVGPRAASPG
jgi:di/tricarboxylate transporter